MNITVTHTLAPEIIALLQNLLKSQAIAERPAGSEFKETAPVKTTPKNDEKKKTTEKTNNGAPELTMENLRAAAQAISKGGKREQVLALVKSFGVDSLPKLDPSKFAEFSEKLKAL